MANEIPGDGLKFYPIYWTHHDSYQYQRAWNDMIHHHWGHVHFFMLGFPWGENTHDAFSGKQNFSFEIKDLWGPRSNDPNQATPYKVIGTPKWYWHVQELWRRVYIQPWDGKVPLPDGQVTGRQGIRWDASPDDKRHGPYREGQGFSPMYIEGGARTLPIEYFTNEDRQRTHRQNYVMDKAQQMIAEWNAQPIGQRFPKVFDPLDWNLDWGSFLGAERGARPTFPDSLYIQPIIEYQKVVHLDWERMPGWEQQHDHGPDDFGDGWANSLQLPFTNPFTQKYVSPFTDVPGQCLPFGEYAGIYSGARQDLQGPLVPVSKRPKYRTRQGSKPTETNPAGGYDFANEPFGLPAFKNQADWNKPEDLPPVPADFRQDLSGKPMTWRNPYPEKTDGRWVQQFLGGIVQVKAELTIEHKMGGRTTTWVGGTQLIPTQGFAGTDGLIQVNA